MLSLFSDFYQWDDHRGFRFVFQILLPEILNQSLFLRQFQEKYKQWDDQYDYDKVIQGINKYGNRNIEAKGAKDHRISAVSVRSRDHQFGRSRADGYIECINRAP